MSHQNPIRYMRPQDVEPALASKVLSFLNTASTVQEILDVVISAGERSIGSLVARNILNERARLGSFRDLSQLSFIPRLGSNRFTRIVNALATIKS